MFSIFKKKKSNTAMINGEALMVAPTETLLQAALRQGIDFPYSCRVGGCASCKCKLVSGQVKALTEASYVLSESELDEGYILACQSMPLTDVRIQVDLTAHAQKRSVKGRVVAQQKLTHDITYLNVQLDETLNYKAGQFADISFDSLDGVVRSYSFATPSQSDSQCSFFIKKVSGGLLSSHVHDASMIGHHVVVEGPMGDFWLRPADAPLLMVAGGSGLAPILAILQENVTIETTRPVTLLFGARQQQDLYAIDEIKAIGAAWNGNFRFVPVLSHEPSQSGWAGERGLVTEKISAFAEAGTHAYLCGPPAMIDHAMHVLTQQGVAKQHIHADRFTNRQDGALAVA